MKTLAFLILLSMPVMPQAQAPADPSQPPDLIVVQLNWTKYFHRPGWDEDVFRPNDERAQEVRAQSTANQTSTHSRARGSQPTNKETADRQVQVPPTSAKVGRPGKEKGILEQYIYSITVKNTGTKQITRIIWDYILTDPNNPEDATHHEFETAVRIKSGKQKKISEISPARPTHVVNTREMNKSAKGTFIERAVINSIEYSDGTSWTRQ